MSLNVSFSVLHCNPSLSAILVATQELLQALSRKTKTFVFVPEELKYNQAQWRMPFILLTNEVLVFMTVQLMVCFDVSLMRCCFRTLSV